METATLTTEQIEQKKQQLKQLAEEVKALKDELVEAGAWPMEEDDLDKATGGTQSLPPSNGNGPGAGLNQITGDTGRKDRVFSRVSHDNP